MTADLTFFKGPHFLEANAFHAKDFVAFVGMHVIVWEPDKYHDVDNLVVWWARWDLTQLSHEITFGHVRAGQLAGIVATELPVNLFVTHLREFEPAQRERASDGK